MTIVATEVTSLTIARTPPAIAPLNSNVTIYAAYHSRSNAINATIALTTATRKWTCVPRRPPPTQHAPVNTRVAIEIALTQIFSAMVKTIVATIVTS